jgi:hypothetical protein
MAVTFSSLLRDRARAALAAGSPVPCVRPAGAYRLVGPLAHPYEWLCLMVFDGPDGWHRLLWVAPRDGAPSPDGFTPIAELTEELGVACLLVERPAT